MNISLRLLKVFAAVSREGSVGRAAGILFVSQPSVSQDIRRLEREIGVVLFVRGAHGMSLTPAGEALQRDVEAALELIDRAVDQARSTAKTHRTRITLAFSPSLGHRLMPAILPLLEQRLRDVVVDEREVDTGAVVPGVRGGHYDLGLAHCPPEESGLTTATLKTEPLCVALASDHPIAKRAQPVRLSELGGLSLMLWPREISPEYYDALVDICHAGGIAPKVIPGPRRAIIRSYALSDGKVFYLLPTSTSDLSVPGITFVPVADPHATIGLVLVRRQNENRPEVLAVASILLSEAPEL